MVALDEGVRGDFDAWPTVDDAVGGETEHETRHRPTAPPPGLAAGMALCIPTLSLIGLLYSLLK